MSQVESEEPFRGEKGSSSFGRVDVDAVPNSGDEGTELLLVSGFSGDAISDSLWVLESFPDGMWPSLAVLFGDGFSASSVVSGTEGDLPFAA